MNIVELADSDATTCCSCGKKGGHRVSPLRDPSSKVDAYEGIICCPSCGAAWRAQVPLIDRGPRPEPRR